MSFIARSIFKFKYYASTGIHNTKLYNFFYRKGGYPVSTNVNNNLLQEIFELKDKSKYITSSLLSKDIAELGMIDNFKENYPFTVCNFEFLIFLIYFF